MTKIESLIDELRTAKADYNVLRTEIAFHNTDLTELAVKVTKLKNELAAEMRNLLEKDSE